MSLQIYDTRQRRKVPFQSLNPPTVRLYTCGQTVYDDAHIGNLRTYLFEDLLRRTLKALGYSVMQVMNITDVDDKTIRGARQKGIPLKEYTAPFIQRLFEDFATLKIERAEHYPAATDHIPEMVALIDTLVKKGYAYQVEGSVYFSISRFADYGKFSGKQLEKLVRGSRVDADEYDDKENFRDFALWKGWTPEDGDIWWDSPWGRGRPGWHIECSAMSMKYLGEEFDIHTGGEDHIFPHHENEIAQSVAATGKGFARYWIHGTHLVINGEKMSKSLGNFYTLRDLIGQGHSPRLLRFYLISTHYRLRLNFTSDGLSAARAGLDRLDTLFHLAVSAASSGGVRANLRSGIAVARKGFAEAMQDDMNISESLAALYDLVSAVHRTQLERPLNQSEGAALLDLWREADQILGVLIPDEEPLDEEIEKAVRTRWRLRAEKRFEEADAIRLALEEKEFRVKDSKEGTMVIWQKGGKLVKMTN